jgi:hypothetical protein
VEPWDSEWTKCVHGQKGDDLCTVGPSPLQAARQVCQLEAERIVLECDEWIKTV